MAYGIEIDRKWQQRWEESGVNKFDPERRDEKLYVLEMFSYPSGSNLHVGHWYNYALSDTWARLKKMQGHNVFQPMGFDAFGLPAENYAIQTGIHPQVSTMQNIATMEKQLREMGGMFDWEYEVVTCLPDYYKWTQWLFLKLYEEGLAYRKNAPVNWCPDCNTVLANEQVVDGECERCGSSVLRKNLTQWFFKITDYAQELLDGLDGIDWPEATKKIQVNWIGRSEGSMIVFDALKEGQIIKKEDGSDLDLPVFTTRADTVFGATYVVVAPDSEVCDFLTTDAQSEQVQAYQDKARRLTEIDRMSTVREKTGVFTGSYAVHPFTGEQIPIWAADYVIAGYGTGVVMAVPAHDERDYEFAVKYDLPIKQVIATKDGSDVELPFVEEGININSGKFDGLGFDESVRAIIGDLAARDKGELTINYRLRDWLVSRQRYWGSPIPMVYCDKCGTVPVPEEDLPVLLPEDVEFKPDGQSPLAKSKSFINTSCPACGGPARRDADTLDTFVCSSFYQMRYADNKNTDLPFARDIVNKMLPVDKYIGGAEHAAMHLLYSRFITKALRDMGYLDFDEPFQSLVHQGTILGRDGQKMSKSKGNTIQPDDYIHLYGSDVFRLYLAFGFAYTEGGPWSDDGVKAIVKFVSRVENLVDRALELQKSGFRQDKDTGQDEKDLNYARHHAIKSVTIDADKFQFNTSVARMMELLNASNKYLAAVKDSAHILYLDTVKDMILLIAPFAPHFAEEMWEKLGGDFSIFGQAWPSFDQEALVKDEIEIAVQINGQVKARLNIPSDADKDQVEEIVLADEAVAEQIRGKKLLKFIYIPGRLANLVVK